MGKNGGQYEVSFVQRRFSWSLSTEDKFGPLVNPLFDETFDAGAVFSTDNGAHLGLFIGGVSNDYFFHPVHEFLYKCVIKTFMHINLPGEAHT